MHGICDAVEEIHDGEEPHKGPALVIVVEGINDHKGCGQNTDYEPGFEFSPAGPRVFDDIAHYRVVESVKDPRRSHDDRYGSELGYAELSRNEDISHQITRKQVIYHVSSDCPQREEPQIFLSLSKIFVHKPALPVMISWIGLLILLYLPETFNCKGK